MFLRGRLIVLLLVYFAGFATAVYNFKTSSDVDPAESYSLQQEGDENSFEADQQGRIKEALKVAAREFVDFGKYASKQIGCFIMEKIRQYHEGSDYDIDEK